MSQYQAYCTYFDQRYLPRGLALYRSLIRHTDNFSLWTLCLDQQTYETLIQLQLPGLMPIRLEDFERDDPELVSARPQRSLVEYYFTLSPSLPLYVLEQNSQAEMVTYLDADLYFFGSPDPIFAEMGTRSIAIIPHRFSTRNKSLEEHGVYNVGMLSFRRDPQGLACLRRWREQCLDWCYDRVEDGKYADQGYLNEWPERYSNLAVIRHKGANSAPWNLDKDPITVRHGSVWVGSDPLIFYHFQSLARIGPGHYKMNLSKYRTKLHAKAREIIYHSYARDLEIVFEELKQFGGLVIPDARLRSVNDNAAFRFRGNGHLLERFASARHALKEQLSGEYFSVSIP